MPIRSDLVLVAKEAAETPFHGYVMTLKSNLRPIVDPFPKWSLRKAEGNVNNLSTVLERPKNSRLRGFIRIPDGWIYEE